MQEETEERGKKIKDKEKLKLKRKEKNIKKSKKKKGHKKQKRLRRGEISLISVFIPSYNFQLRIAKAE